MAIEWHAAHWGVSAQAYDGRRLRGQVVRYDVTEAGRTELLGHEWRAFLGGHQVNGPVPTCEEAQALLERAARTPIRG